MTTVITRPAAIAALDLDDRFIDEFHGGKPGFEST